MVSELAGARVARLEQNLAVTSEKLYPVNTPIQRLIHKEIQQLPVISQFNDMCQTLLSNSQNRTPSSKLLALNAVVKLPDEKIIGTFNKAVYSTQALGSTQISKALQGSPALEQLLGRFTCARYVANNERVGLKQGENWFLGKKNDNKEDCTVGLFYKGSILPHLPYLQIERKQQPFIKEIILTSGSPALDPQEQVLSVSNLQNKFIGQKWNPLRPSFEGLGQQELFKSNGRLYKIVSGTWKVNDSGKNRLTGQGTIQYFNPQGRVIVKSTGRLNFDKRYSLTGPGTLQKYNEKNKLTMLDRGTWQKTKNGSILTGKGSQERYDAKGQLREKIVGSWGDEGLSCIMGAVKLETFDREGKPTSIQSGKVITNREGKLVFQSHWTIEIGEKRTRDNSESSSSRPEKQARKNPDLRVDTASSSSTQADYKPASHQGKLSQVIGVKQERKRPLNMNQEDLAESVAHVMSTRINQPDTDCVGLTIALYNSLARTTQPETNQFNFSQRTHARDPLRIKQESGNVSHHPTLVSHVLTSAKLKNFDQILQPKVEIEVDLTRTNASSKTIYDLTNKRASHRGALKSSLTQQADRVARRHNTNVMLLTIGRTAPTEGQLANMPGHMMLLINTKTDDNTPSQWFVLDPQQMRSIETKRDALMTTDRFAELYDDQTFSQRVALLPTYGITND